MQKFEVNTFDEAIAAFLATLNSEKKNELLMLIPNPRVPAGRRWIDSVIAMFQLDTPEGALCRDIALRFEDESVFVGEIFGNANGIFEAEILLREAKKSLKLSLNANSN